MLLSGINPPHRVALQFGESRPRSYPKDHSSVWESPSVVSNIRDEMVIQHSDGCAVSTLDVEKVVSNKRVHTFVLCHSSEKILNYIFLSEYFFLQPNLF